MFKFLIFVSVVHNVAVHSEYTRWHATRDEGFVSANIIVEGKRTFKSNEFHVKKNVKRDVLLQDVAGRIANFASQTSSNYIVQCAIYGTSTTATSAVPGLLQCTDSEANAAQYLYPLLHLPSPPLFPPAFTYTNTILLQCIWSGKRGVSGRQFTQFTHHCRRMQCTNLISLALPISNLKSIYFKSLDKSELIVRYRFNNDRSRSDVRT